MKRLEHKSDRELVEEIHEMLTYLMGDLPAARAILHDGKTQAELRAREEAGNRQAAAIIRRIKSDTRRKRA